MTNTMTSYSSDDEEEKVSSVEDQIAKAKAFSELLWDAESERGLLWEMLWDSNSSFDDNERAGLFNSIINSPEKDDEFRTQIYAKIDQYMPNPEKLKVNIIFFKYSPEDAKLTEEAKIELFKKLLSEEDKLSHEEEQSILTYISENNIPLE